MGKKQKWLLRKISGSRGKYAYKPDYSESRKKKHLDPDHLPYKEPIKKGNSYLDTSLVKRWLYAQVGKDFDEVYAQFLKRIQPKYLDEYRHCIFWYVSKSHELSLTENKIIIKPWAKKFYINPITNKLEEHADQALKEAKPIFLYTKYGSLKYSLESKVWSCKVPNSSIEVFVKDEAKELNIKLTYLIDNTIEKMEFLTQKAKSKIAGLAIKSNNTEIILSKKKILSIHFDLKNGLNKYYLLMRVEKDIPNWKIDFVNYEISNIVRINNRI